MSKHQVRCLCVGIAMGIAIIALVVWPAGAAADPVVPQSVQRDLEPVIVNGASVPLLQGAPRQDLYVYAYSAGELRQIPYQIDQVTAGGAYTYTVPGGPLGPADEIVFMASDLGDMVPPATVTASLPISTTWYQIEVTDSLSPTLKGWAYVVRSSALDPVYAGTYAYFDTDSKQIHTNQYFLGFATTHQGFDYLALNGSGVDILDRTKVRINTLLGTFTEEDLGSPDDAGVIADGPVRVLARGGAVRAYGAMIQTVVTYTLPFGVLSARASTDFSVDAVTSTFYNANTLAGVPVDGKGDAVATTPLSPWWQLSGSTGTVVQVIDASRVSGTLTNYYMDNAALDPTDPGDNRSYADTGMRTQGPSGTIDLRTAYVILPADLPPVGHTYAAYLASPLQIQATAQSSLTNRVYLPVLMK